MKLVRRHLVEILLVGLVCLVLVAFWGFRHFPSQDGASHVYNAHVLGHLDDPDGPYDAVYERRAEFVPNLLAGVALENLGRLMPLPLAEKLLLTVYLLAFVGGFAALARQDGRLAPVALLGPVFAFNYALVMGFYSFLLGSAAAIWGWVLADRALRKPGWAAPLALAALGLVAFAAHVVTAGLLLLGVTAHAARAALGQRSVRPLVNGMLPLVPVVALMAIYVARGMPSGAVYWPLGYHLRVLPTLRGLVAYTGAQQWIAIVFAVALLVLVVWRLTERRRSPAAAAWVVLALACVVAYLVLPNGSDGHWYLGDRLSLFAWIALVPLACVRRAVVMQAIVLGVLAAWFIGLTLPHQALFDRELREHRSLAARIEPGRHLLGLVFEEPHRRGPGRARPWLHATGWIAVERNGVDVGNYEAHTDHFQIRLRPGVSLPDPFALETPGRFAIDPYVPTIRYVVTRGLDDHAQGYRRQLERSYREIARAGASVLFERNP